MIVTSSMLHQALLHSSVPDVVISTSANTNLMKDLPVA